MKFFVGQKLCEAEKGVVKPRGLTSASKLIYSTFYLTFKILLNIVVYLCRKLKVYTVPYIVCDRKLKEID